MEYTLELVEGQMPLKEARGTFHVEELPDNCSLVTGHFKFVMKYGLLGQLLEYVLLRPKLHQVLDKVFAGFAYHVNTGKMVTNEDSLETLNAGANQKS